MSEQDMEWQALSRIWQSERAASEDLATSVRRQSVRLWLYVVGGSVLVLIGLAVGFGLLVYGDSPRHQVGGSVIVAVLAVVWPWELWVRRGTLRARCESSAQMVALQVRRCRVNIKALAAARLAFVVSVLFFLAMPFAAVLLREPRLAISPSSIVLALLIYGLSIAATTWLLARQRAGLEQYREILESLREDGADD